MLDSSRTSRLTNVDSLLITLYYLTHKKHTSSMFSWESSSNSLKNQSTLGGIFSTTCVVGGGGSSLRIRFPPLSYTLMDTESVRWIVSVSVICMESGVTTLLCTEIFLLRKRTEPYLSSMIEFTRFFHHLMKRRAFVLFNSCALLLKT